MFFKNIKVFVFLFSVFAVVVMSQQHTQRPRSQQFNLGDFLRKIFNDHFYEVTAVIITSIYALNYLLGKSLNAKHARNWAQQNKSVFASEFMHVGVSNNPQGDLLESETANLFKFYASGRPNCVYALTTIEFKRRQDLFSMVVLNFFKVQKDRLRIEIPIETASALPFIFALVQRKQAKLVQKNYPEVQHFCKKMSLDELNQEYIIFAEDDRISDYVLTNSVISTLKSHKDVIEMLSISDLKKPYKQYLKVDLLMPNKYLKNPQEFHEILKMLFYLADHIAAYKMSNADRTKAEKERKIYESNQSKDERKKEQSKIQRELQEKKDSSSKKKTDQNDDSKKKMQKKNY